MRHINDKHNLSKSDWKVFHEAFFHIVEKGTLKQIKDFVEKFDVDIKKAKVRGQDVFDYLFRDTTVSRKVYFSADFDASSVLSARDNEIYNYLKERRFPSDKTTLPAELVAVAPLLVNDAVSKDEIKRPKRVSVWGENVKKGALRRLVRRKLTLLLSNFKTKKR